jgi:hypothetical protein
LSPPISRIAARVEREEHADVTCGRDQFLHVLVSRLFDRVHERPPEARPSSLEDVHGGRKALPSIWSSFDGCPRVIDQTRLSIRVRAS